MLANQRELHYFCSCYKLIYPTDMDSVRIKIINSSSNPLPAYGSEHAAGMDVRAWLPDGPLSVAPMERVLVPTGLRVELPEGYEMQLRPRSGLALRSGITLANSPGTVDADYRGEIGIIVINLSHDTFEINDGDRICQMVVTRYSRVDWDCADVLSDTERGEGGFGHTGVS